MSRFGWSPARAERTDVSPLRLQRLLFLAQTYFAGSTHGGRLMPSFFIASRAGPIEPNIARIRNLESSMIEVSEPSKAVSDFLEGIWQAFGENGIAFPYPQRDLHIKSVVPLMVETAAQGQTGS